jgi:hypothetical protein
VDWRGALRGSWNALHVERLEAPQLDFDDFWAPVPDRRSFSGELAETGGVAPEAAPALTGPSLPTLTL